jgi:hypothetical protein
MLYIYAFFSALAAVSIFKRDDMPGYFYPSQSVTWIQPPLSGSFGETTTNFGSNSAATLAEQKEAAIEYMMNQLGISDRTQFKTTSSYALENNLIFC